MNSRLLLLTPIIFTLACQIKERNIYKKYPSGKFEYLVSYPNKDDTGTCTIRLFYPSGGLHIIAMMKDNQYIGRKIVYYENGMVSQIDSLSAPCDTTTLLCDGNTTHFYDNGVISGKYTIKSNAFNGLAKQYLKDGTIVKEWEIFSDTIRNGIYKEYYNNGNRAFVGHFRMDTLVGFAYFFDENGDTAKYYNTLKGEIDFTYKKWLDGGRILIGDYSADKKDVIWIWLNVKGDTLKTKRMRLHKGEMVMPE